MSNLGNQGQPYHQSMYGAQYVRQQKGHSVVVHCLMAVFLAGISLPWTIYYTLSPNHFWHL